MTADAPGPASVLRVLRESPVQRTERLRARVTELYEAHREAIYRFLVAQGLPPAVAQEVTQDVFVQFFVALQSGTQIGADQAWLFSVAARKAVDYWRREGQARWVELDTAAEGESPFRSTDPTPEAKAARAQQLRRVADALSRLPREQRLCVLLRSKGLRYREIAEILGVAISTTSEWLATAVERLRGAAHD